MNKLRTVLSLFDGMSVGQIALRQLGITPEIYYASEIDKYAIKQTQFNFPDTIQLGDIEKWREWDIDFSKVDLIMAGSPCQGFSFAGKQLAFDDPRSKLFFVFVDILNHVRKHNPDVKFLLENVRMKKAHERIISEFCGLFPVMINSALVSAQNRERLYWSNIRTKQVGLFGEMHTDIPQPKDKGILLRDILEKEVDEKYYVSQSVLDISLRKTYSSPALDPDKTGTLNTKNNSGQMAIDSGTTFITQAIGFDRGKLREITNEKSTCIDAHYSQFSDNHGQRTGIIQRSRGNNKGGVFVNKAPTLSTCSYEHNNLVCKRGVIQINPATDSGGKQPYQQDRIYDINGISPALLAGLSSGTHAISANRIRRLTPLECSRLQTIPDWYKWICSDTQIYKMLGNGWTCEVIIHILNYLKQ